jgi:replicative DNA helicase
VTDDLPGDLPNDIGAERFVLGAMMAKPAAIEQAVELLEPDDFYRPAHGVIFRAMVIMAAADTRADPVTIREWLQRDGDLRALGAGAEIYLAELMAEPVIPESVEHYAKLVLAASRRRAGLEQASRLRAACLNPCGDPDEVLGRVDDWMEGLRRGAGRVRWGETRAELAARVTRMPPVIPGLVHAQDRVVVVATEGRGKTTLAHQVAFAAAAGCHPFAGTQIEPQRVVIIDLENPLELLDRRFGALAETAARYPGWDEGNVTYHADAGGIDVTKADDAFAFAGLVRRHKAALVIAGPLYKMVRPKDAGDALRAHLRLAEFLDRLRQRYGCAIWLEAHAPFGAPGDRELRPEGSNIWTKWPEFGLTLRRGTKAHGGDDGVEIGRFRGHRDQTRTWPVALTRNVTPGGWPWAAVWPAGTWTEEPPPNPWEPASDR